LETISDALPSRFARPQGRVNGAVEDQSVTLVVVRPSPILPLARKRLSSWRSRRIVSSIKRPIVKSTASCCAFLPPGMH
jgi:hypothetical protein